MKKAAFLLIAGLVMTGCSQSYLAEREFWKAEKVLNSISRDEGPMALDRAADAFQKVADRYPQTPKALESLQIISNIRLRQKNFSGAREAMTQYLQRVGGVSNKAVDARFRIAQIYEMEGNWAEAEKRYWETAQFHSLHVKGLYSPVYVLSHYVQAQDLAAVEKTYVRVLDHFTKLKKEVGPIEAGAPVRNYFAMAYMVKDEWQKAVQEWTSISKDFPENAYAPMGILAAAELSWKKKNYGDAYALYGQYFEKYPDHSLVGRTAVGVGLLHLGNREFPAARDWFTRALKNYFSNDPAAQAEIKLLIGRSYHEEGLWPEASRTYEDLLANHPSSPSALQVPLQQAAYYKGIGDGKTADKILSQALVEYAKRDAEGPEEVRNLVRRLRVTALAQKGDWETLTSDVDRYMAEETTEDKRGRWLYLKALLTKNRLKNPDEALQIYNEFLSTYPDHPLSTRAKDQIKLMASEHTAGESAGAMPPESNDSNQIPQ